MSIVQAVDYHVPVMLEECLEGMNLQPTGHYVDVTFGGGGHSRAILDRLSDGGHLYSFDQDPDAAARAEETERFMTDMQDLSSPMTVMKRWLSEEDYQTLLDAHLTGRQALVLLREANRHYEALLGDQGEGRSSGTA